MSSTEIALPSTVSAAQRADFISQTTAVEQARAVAEVQAAVVVAQQVPRDLALAVAAMRESCRQPGLADRAFFKFPRAGGSVSGPSVHLARELARCWGNVQYGIQEMRRDEVGHYSEMQAWAWDVQTNTRSSTTFVVPHMRDKKGGPEILTDLRDVYENNANQGSRRLRETIFSILPPWFTEEAKAICTTTLKDGGGKSLAQMVADAVAKFEGLGIKVERLERKIGSARTAWTEHDIAGLRVSYASLQQGTVSAEEEFPSDRVSAADVLAQAAPAPAPAPAAETPAPSPAPAVPATTTAPRSSRSRVSTPANAGAEYGDVVNPGREQTMTGPQMIAMRGQQHGVDTSDKRALMCSQIVGREVVSSKDLNPEEVAMVLSALNALGEDEDFPFADAKVDTAAGEVLGSSPDLDVKADAHPLASPPSPPAVSHAADEWPGDEWRKVLGKHSGWLKMSDLLKQAKTLATDAGRPVPVKLDDICDTGIGGMLFGWVEDRALGEGQS